MIKSLTSLRGIFILFIFFHHAGIYPGGGSLAVAFFFVLSGFSMMLGYKDKVIKTDFSYKQYITRRCIKFYPLHWITLVADIPLVLMSTLHLWLIPVFFVNAALLQTLIPIQEVYFSYNAVSWFLADIFFFAIIFPFVSRYIIKSKLKKRIVIAVAIMFVYFFVALIVPSDFRHAILYISPYIRITDFIFGIFLALLYNRVYRENARCHKPSYSVLVAIIILVVALVAESFLLSSSLQLIAPLYWPLIAVLIIVASLPENGDVPFLNNRILVCLGESSFTIFLVHRLVLRYTSKLVEFDNILIYVVFCLVLTLIVTFLIDKFILIPITQWLTKKQQPSMTAQL